MTRRGWLVGLTALPLLWTCLPNAAWADVPDLFVGSGGANEWARGSTTPAAAVPFGMIQFGPDTSRADGKVSASAAGYHSSDTHIRGFSPTHLSGAGCRAFGDVPILPVRGALPRRPWAAASGFARSTERAHPGYYSVRLNSGVSARLTAAERAGFASFTFPRRSLPRLIIKASGALAGTRQARVTFPSPREVAISATSGGFCRSPNRYRVHMLLRFSQPVAARRTWGGTRLPREAAGAGVGAHVRFARAKAAPLRVQVGVSFTDLTGARRNLDRALRGRTFAGTRDRAATLWRAQLARLAVTGGSPTQRRVFQTALYHSMLHPSLVSDADGRYRGFDGLVRRLAPGVRHYSAISGWDAYRTHMPLLAWLRPDVASEVIASLIRDAVQGGWLPRWPMVNAYTGVMNGDPAAALAASAWAFGARGFSLETMLGHAVRQAETESDHKGQGWFQPRPGIADYLTRGYVPNNIPDWGMTVPSGASQTLEYAVSDFAIARLASYAGKPELASRFHERSGNWRNLFDDSRGYILPRDGAGNFPAPGTDVAACCTGFMEGNAVQYAWMVPQDMAGVLDRIGRPRALQRLDDFFTHLNAGGGPYAWMGNEPSFATPWVFHYLGRPDRTADVVRRVRTELYTLGPNGLPGNDDLGSLSAWYILASIGLYPLTPGTAAMGLSTPAFDTVTVRPSSGAPTVIRRTGMGDHVAAVSVDGQPHGANWLDLQARRPSQIVFATTNDPAPGWGVEGPPSWPVSTSG